MQGGFSVWIGHKKGPTKMKDFARFKPMQRHIFLYEKAVVFCKRRVETGEGSDRYPSYSFKHCLKVRQFELPNITFGIYICISIPGGMLFVAVQTSRFYTLTSHLNLSRSLMWKSGKA